MTDATPAATVKPFRIEGWGSGGGGADDLGCCPLPHSWVLDGAWEGNGLAVITYRTP